MGAKQFLNLSPLPDALRAGETHELGLIRMGDDLFLKVSLAAPGGNDQAYCEDGAPYTARISASLRMSPQQLKRMQTAISEALGSFGA